MINYIYKKDNVLIVSRIIGLEVDNILLVGRTIRLEMLHNYDKLSVQNR